MKRIFTFGSLSAGAYFALLLVLPSTCLADGYPGDYTPSAPAETGNTNILARFGALLTYVNAKLEAAYIPGEQDIAAVIGEMIEGSDL